MAVLLKTRAAVRRPARPTAGAALLVALLGAAGYAVFADGAVPPAQAAWLEVGVALIAALAAAAWLGADRVRAGASPLAVAGVVLLALAVAWTAISLVWSVAPDRTWTDVNRTLAYVLVAAVALLAGAAPRAVERVALGWLAIAVATAVYALAGKVLPGVIDDAAGAAVLRSPLGAPGALGLVCVLGAPVAVRVATDRLRRPLARGGALVALMLLLTCAGLTYSRAAFLALAVALVVLTAVGGPRLRGLAAFALGAVAAAPALAFGWGDDALSRSGAALSERIDAGLILGALLLAGAAALVAAALALSGLERRTQWSRRRSQRAWFALAALAVALAAAGVTAVATSERGLSDSVEEAVDDFTDAGARPDDEPDRLLSTSSAGRSAWWEEAFAAFADEPVRGWGGGSFLVSRRVYRATTVDAADPHDLPLRFAAETGAVGLVLGIGGLALLVAGAAGGVRRRAREVDFAVGDERERDLAVALLAASAAWAVHALVDPDWAVPGATVPVLLFLGVLGARAVAPRPEAVREQSAGRWLALGAVCLMLAAAAASAVLPAWSSAKSDDAERAAGARSPAALEDGAADAELAARLNPLAVRPLLAAASVAEARGRRLEARRHLLDAVERAPHSAEAWWRLTRLALALADREGARRAALRLLALDPANPRVVAFVERVQAAATPPESSATATGTPLPP